MDSNALLTIIASIFILICIVVALIIRFKSKPSIYDEETATNFLNGLSDVFYNKITNIIENINFSDYSSLVELETDVLKQIYDTILNYTKEYLNQAAKDDIITSIVYKLLNNDEKILKFVDELIEKYSIIEKLEYAWAKNFKTKTADMSEADSKLESLYADKSQYIETVSNNDLVPAKDISPTEEELEKLNPPSDEDIDYDPENDESVEIVDEDSYIDKHGRLRSKSTGRFI